MVCNVVIFTNCDNLGCDNLEVRLYNGRSNEESAQDPENDADEFAERGRLVFAVALVLGPMEDGNEIGKETKEI